MEFVLQEREGISYRLAPKGSERESGAVPAPVPLRGSRSTIASGGKAHRNVRLPLLNSQ